MASRREPSSHVEELIFLRNRVDELEYEKAERDKRECDLTTRFIDSWGLSPQEARFLIHIYNANGVISREKLFTSLFGYDEGPESNTLNVVLYKVRKKLAPDGITIETLWGRGFRLTPQSQAKIKAIVEAPCPWMQAGAMA